MHPHQLTIRVVPLPFLTSVPTIRSISFPCKNVDRVTIYTADLVCIRLLSKMFIYVASSVILNAKQSVTFRLAHYSDKTGV